MMSGSVFQQNMIMQSQESSWKFGHSPADQFAISIMHPKEKKPSIKGLSFDDTPPEERDRKDILLMSLANHTLKDVDFENMVIG